jgi:hypothetical protein
MDQKPPQELKRYSAKRALSLLDRGDGVKGHFCIGKPMERGSIYWHFWNDDHNGGGWCSAGSVYVGRRAARTKLREVAANVRTSDRL